MRRLVVATSLLFAISAQSLQDRPLAMPVLGMKLSDLRDTFDEHRDGERKHEATDILAPRGTPVVAVEDGTIVSLFLSRFGGNTIYEFDPQEKFCYYYAHLERYADGLKKGNRVKKGEVIGYVGTSGNAPRGTPHLHFGITIVGPEKKWNGGLPIDPYPILRAAYLKQH